MALQKYGDPRAKHYLHDTKTVSCGSQQLWLLAKNIADAPEHLEVVTDRSSSLSIGNGTREIKLKD